MSEGAFVLRDDLAAFCDDLLGAQNGHDYGPNGLQVEGREQIRHLVTAVSANVELFERAIELRADALLVHHGILWNHQARNLVGPMAKRVKMLMDNGISLLGYHLPLDRHLEVGNAAALIKRMGCAVDGPFGDHRGYAVGVRARVPDWSPEDLERRFEAVVGAPMTTYMSGPARIQSMAVVTGGGQGYVQDAISEGVDAFLTGEVTEWTRAMVQEAGIHFLAGGHYRTEQYGVQEVGARIEEKFGIRVGFVDIPNPV